MVLDVCSVAKKYGDIELFHQLSLELKSGESVAISGASGSGKTSLLSIMAGLDLDFEGDVKLLGQSIKSLSSNKLQMFRALNTGVIFQEFHLLESLTLLENVLLPLKLLKAPISMSHVDGLLERVGLKERKHHFPWQCSGGEQQRASLARALVHQPKLIFADEPTGNLDEKNASVVSDLLFEMCKNQGCSLFLITHNQELAQECNRHYKLHLGVLNLDNKAI